MPTLAYWKIRGVRIFTLAKLLFVFYFLRFDLFDTLFIGAPVAQ